MAANIGEASPRGAFKVSEPGPSLSHEEHAPARSQMFVSPGFGRWLDDLKGSLVITTMSPGLLLLMTGNGEGSVLMGARRFNNPRGLSIDGERMWITGDTSLFHFANHGASTVDGAAHDAIYVANRAYFVGAGLLHDVVHSVSLNGEPLGVVFVNTNYSVIATVDDDHSFRPLWKPKHIDKLVAADHCHLNCIGIRDGEVAFASMFSLTDTAEGWRNAADNAGVIVDVQSREVICSGLAKPHSLKWHQGRLWALNSVAGDFGYVDADKGQFVPVTHIGNFLRGLFMIGDYAVIGASALRGQAFQNAFQVPGLESLTKARAASALYVVDLRSGEIAHAAVVQGIETFYDIGFIGGVTRPLVVRLQGQDDNKRWTSYNPNSLP